LVVALFLLAIPHVQAQEVTGTIDGTVKDAAGGLIPGAEVTALHASTGSTRKTLTVDDGSYVFTALPIGTYDLSVSLPGFKKAVRKGVELHIADHLRIDITLEVGEISEQVAVVASAAQVETESSEQSTLISGEQVRDLQLNGRSFMTLLELLPGVASDMPDRADPNTNPSLSINGARSSQSNFNIDGSSNMDVIVGSSSLNTFTSVDTIAEVKVITSIAPAEYGKGGFSQVNVVTRGGTKRFHGSLYEFFRNDALDARDWLTHQVLPLKLNNFGFTIGGPVLLPGGYNKQRNKTFFFFTQEFNHISTRGAAVNTRVPTAEERRGNFSSLGPGADRIFGTADDPVIDPETKVGFANGIMPASRIDPNAVKLLNLYPLPNFRGPGNINFTSAAPSLQRWREELIRIDHNFSPYWKIFGRWSQDSAFIRNPYGGSSVSSIATNFPGIGATRAGRPGKNLVVNMVNIFSPTLLNEFMFTYSGREITQTPIRDDADRAKLGIDIPEIFPENIGNIIPTVNLGSSYAALNVSRVWLKQLFNLEFSNNLTKTFRRHVVKTGAIYSFGGNRENPTGPNTNGSFTFTTNFSKNPVANMLLGLPNTYSEAERLVVSHARFGFFEAYIQDDFKASRRLTLNVGVRYSALYNPYDTEDVLTNFLPSAWDPARAPKIDPAFSSGLPVSGAGDPLNGIIIAGKNSPFGRRVTENNTDLIGPRAGFAWAPFNRNKLAIRGGYGIFFTRPLIGTFINNAFDNPPFSRSVTIQQPAFGNPGGGREDAAGVPSLTALGTPMLAPTIQQWGLGVQYEIFREAILDVAYVGSHGTHLFRPYNLNSPPPNTAVINRQIHPNALRPFPGYGSITQRQSSASSVYHSLQLKFNRRMADKASMGVAYTFSKSIDDSSSDRGGSDIPPDSRNARAERGPSDFDRAHIFTANYIWYLPDAVRGGNLALLLNGWQMSGITRMWSGKPFDVALSTDVAGIGTVQNQRPDVIAGTRGPRTPEEWFSRSAFARPATGTFGNMGRNSIRGPGINKWDLALFKNFQLREGMRLQFRCEAFNAFNHVSFDAVGRTLTTTSTGVNPNTGNFAVVTDTRDARVLQFALKVTF
jgi:hypothetical protein